MTVKVKTFRNILLLICAAYTALLFCPPFSFAKLVFKDTDNTMFEYWDLMLYVIFFLAVPAFIYAAKFFKENKYNVMTKRGICVFSLTLAFLIILPYAEYPARTEITSQTITKHNLIGQVTKVYEYENAESVTVGLIADGFFSKHSGVKARLHFTYNVKFEDGYSYDFEGPSDDEKWNRIINEVNATIKENGIKKEIVGEIYLNPDYPFDNYSDSIAPNM